MENTKGIVARPQLAVNNTGGLTAEQTDLVKRTVAVGATDDELRLFLYTADRTGLDPLTRQIHFIKRSKNVKNPDGSWRKEDVATIQTGIDGFRVVAQRSGQYAGQGKVIYGPMIKFLGYDVPEWAEVEVYRKDCEYSIPARAYFREYAQAYNERLGPMWARMPYLMIAKCAEALALRKAFPNDLSGLYTAEEMAQADEPVVKAAPIPARLAAPVTPPVAPQPVPAQPKTAREELGLPPDPDEPPPQPKPAPPQPTRPVTAVTGQVVPPRPAAAGTAKPPECVQCAAIITPKVAEYSKKEFGMTYCFDCQQEIRGQKRAGQAGLIGPH